MCLNCGCNQPNERHGNDANITADDVRRAGEANGQDRATSAANMRSSLAAMAGNSRSAGDAKQPHAAGSGAKRPDAAPAPSVTGTTRAPR